MLADLDEGEGGVRGDSKVSIGMSEWLVIPLREKAEGRNPRRDLSWEAGERR